ncbi:MAG: MerR family transcriptional regulator [Desulfobacteraceae bacterium]|jgi:DNA-binding transcriptional MerR regulator|nr:MAG: MerR family transcriptional regulator [Desulfobacteraceae bacterium]
MKNETRTFTIDDICSLVEMTKRTVRFYIQKGLLERPLGTGKGAYYTHSHLEQLLEIRKWKEAGLSLERIEEIVAAKREGSEYGRPTPPPARRKRGSVEVWSHIIIDDGVEIHLEPGRSGLSPEEVRKVAAEMTRLYRRIKEGSCDE